MVASQQDRCWSVLSRMRFVSRSCHFMSAILRLYISVATTEGESCHLVKSSTRLVISILSQPYVGFDDATVGSGKIAVNTAIITLSALR